MNRYLFILVFALSLSFAAHSEAQTPSASPQTSASAAAPDRALGEVTAVDTSARQLTLNTTAGKQVLVKLDSKAIFRRVPPGEKTLEKAVEISLLEIGPGDRVLARGTADEKQEVLLARLVVVMSKAEIREKRERDRAEWLQRGIAGVVTAIDPASKEITLRSQSAQSIVIKAAEGVRFRRYAPDSVKFADARASTFDQLKVGDQVRALGDKSADGTHYTAEEIMSGTFQTIGGTIVTGATAGELTVKNLKNNQVLTVAVAKDSIVRRLTPELVQLLEQRAAGKQQASGDLQNMIESLPPIAVTDLRPGEAILISTTVGANSSRVTAAIIAAGLDEFFKRQQKTGVQRELNLGLGLPAGVNP